MDGIVTLQRVEAQIDMLRLQEHDTCWALSRPETKPGVHQKLHRALERIRSERDRLCTVLQEAAVQGREALRWSELYREN